MRCMPCRARHAPARRPGGASRSRVPARHGRPLRRPYVSRVRPYTKTLRPNASSSTLKLQQRHTQDGRPPAPTPSAPDRRVHGTRQPYVGRVRVAGGTSRTRRRDSSRHAQCQPPPRESSRHSTSRTGALSSPNAQQRQDHSSPSPRDGRASPREARLLHPPSRGGGCEATPPPEVPHHGAHVMRCMAMSAFLRTRGSELSASACRSSRHCCCNCLRPFGASAIADIALVT